MRKIKFRAWDERAKKYVTKNDEVFINDEGCVFSSDICVGSYSYENYVIEQFTGLHDKNRNDAEVYEGDIYQWCGLSFPITIDDSHGYRFMFGQDMLCRAFIENGKYRGNIHENPELLK